MTIFFFFFFCIQTNDGSGVDDIQKDYEFQIMKSEQELLMARSKTIILDLKYPFVSFHVCQFQILSIIVGNVGWIYDQYRRSQKYGHVSHYCELKEDQAIFLVAEFWADDVDELIRNIYTKLASSLNASQVDNLYEYIQNYYYKSSRWTKIHAKLEKLDDTERPRELLRMFRHICHCGYPMIFTRALQFYKKAEVKEADVMRRGAIDPMMSDVLGKIENGEKIPGFNSEKIENVVMIGECYYFGKTEINKSDYYNDMKGWFIEITDNKKALEKIDLDFNVLWDSKKLDYANADWFWSRKLRKISKKNYEMRIRYDRELFAYAKRFLLRIVNGKKMATWLDMKGLGLLCGYHEHAKLENIRIIHHTLTETRRELELARSPPKAKTPPQSPQENESEKEQENEQQNEQENEENESKQDQENGPPQSPQVHEQNTNNESALQSANINKPNINGTNVNEVNINGANMNEANVNGSSEPNNVVSQPIVSSIMVN